jgi:hypothetical protein
MFGTKMISIDAKFEISGHSIPTEETHEAGHSPSETIILNYRNDTLLYRMH